MASTSDQFTVARRLLHSSPPPAAAVPYNSTADSTFDANVIMVLSVLLCALICSLGLNSIIRCALRCSNLVPAGDDQLSHAAAARLANTGIKKKALKTFPTVCFSDQLNLPGLDAECVICLSEFVAGERVKILPKCNHGFHDKCIDKWLGSHSSCPTCRHCLIETCQKIVGCSTPAPAVVAVAPVTVVVVAEEVDTGSSSTPPSTSSPPPPPPQAAATVAPAGEVVISMPPLEPEGLVRGYRGDS